MALHRVFGWWWGPPSFLFGRGGGISATKWAIEPHNFGWSLHSRQVNVLLRALGGWRYDSFRTWRWDGRQPRCTFSSSLSVCVCVCVCKRRRNGQMVGPLVSLASNEREREREREKATPVREMRKKSFSAGLGFRHGLRFQLWQQSVG